MRVLLVDDNEQLRSLTRRIVERAGMTIAGEVGDGSQALDFLEREQVDAVVMDDQMPVMDGIEAAREIRERCPGIPVVAFSSDGGAEQAMKESGAVAFVFKGPGISDLTAVLRSLPKDREAPVL